MLLAVILYLIYRGFGWIGAHHKPSPTKVAREAAKDEGHPASCREFTRKGATHLFRCTLAGVKDEFPACYKVVWFQATLRVDCNYAEGEDGWKPWTALPQRRVRSPPFGPRLGHEPASNGYADERT